MGALTAHRPWGQRVYAHLSGADQLRRLRQEWLQQTLDFGNEARQRRHRLFLRLPQVNGDPAVVACIHHQRAERAWLAVVERLELIELRLTAGQLGWVVLVGTTAYIMVQWLDITHLLGKGLRPPLEIPGYEYKTRMSVTLLPA
jgi:hypothetical protein